MGADFWILFISGIVLIGIIAFIVSTILIKRKQKSKRVVIPIGIVIALILCLGLYMLVTPNYVISSASQTDLFTATDYVQSFSNAGLPIENIIEHTESTDPNDLLGRPGGYTSKVNFADSRIEQYDITDPYGGTVEVFITKNDTEKRRDHLEAILNAMDIFGGQYIYVSEDGLAILRLEYDITPSQAAEYETVFLNFEDYLDAENTAMQKTVLGQSSSEEPEATISMPGPSSEATITTPDLSSETMTAAPVPVSTPTLKPIAVPTIEPTPQPTIEPTPQPTPIPTQASSSDPYPLIREYAQSEWGDDASMVEWEYDLQVTAYKYCNSLSNSDIKSYALKEWQEGKYTIWTMVQWEYDLQVAACNFMQNIDWGGKQAAIDCWTEGGYIIWTMVQWEYEHQ